MIERFVFNKSMDSISSYREAFDFSKETLSIPLDYLSALTPIEVEALLPTPTRGVAVYRNDSIEPFYYLSNKDRFFIKTGDKFTEVSSTANHAYRDLYFLGKSLIEEAQRPVLLQEVQESFKRKGLFYTPSNEDQFFMYHGGTLKPIQEFNGFINPERTFVLRKEKLLNATKPKPFLTVFGQSASLERSHKATLRLLGARTFCLWLDTLNLHDLYVDVRIPTVEQIIPRLSFDNWYNYDKIKGQEKVNKSVLETLGEVHFVPEYEVDPDEYVPSVTKLLTPKINNLIDLISSFYEVERDCHYRVRLDGERLLFIKGIDFKYLPYYAQKFGNEL